MKKSIFALTVLAFFVAIPVFASTVSSCGTLTTIVHPDAWGLDGTITAVISAIGIYLIGLFTKKPTSKK